MKWEKKYVIKSKQEDTGTETSGRFLCLIPELYLGKIER